MYAVFDSKAEVFLNPVVFPNTGIAIRWFTALVMDQETEIYKFAEDFALMEIGTYLEKIGKVESLSVPRAVVTAFAVKANLKQENGNG